ncbi:MAG: histidine ammonia-lyase [Planctomycetes bacterium]|nr:histidine ammonia-lyase [Planctomycetota bacterium]
MSLNLTGRDLDLEAVARFLAGERVAVPAATWRKVAKARGVVERLLRGGRPIYGVNTGFGRLANVRIPDGQIRDLQLNLLRSHAVGVGPFLPRDEARLALLLRANTLARGHSGVTRRLIAALVALANAGIAPAIPEQGSVGASGDLAPLAHLALVLVGEGEAFLPSGRRVPGAEALRRAGVKPVALEAKEGISLINGTQIMSAILAVCLLRAQRLASTADVAAAMSLEGLKGTKVAFDARIQAVRPHPGQAACARNVMRLMKGSGIWPSHRNCEKVQDQYSLRCVPQVHGAARDAIGYARGVLDVEMNAVTDNPLVFPEDGAILSGGNFHGQPVAQAADFAALGICELGAISERRIESLVNPDLSGLPPFLSRESGLNSGMMILQVVAAALVSENKIYAHPACVDSIPTSANKEDHVSMGVTSALKLRRILDNVERVLAIEFLAAAQGIEFARPLRAGNALERVHAAIRRRVPALGRDRSMAADIEKVRGLIGAGGILEAAGSLE